MLWMLFQLRDKETAHVKSKISYFLVTSVWTITHSKQIEIKNHHHLQAWMETVYWIRYEKTAHHWQNNQEEYW